MKKKKVLMKISNAYIQIFCRADSKEITMRFSYHAMYQAKENIQVKLTSTIWRESKFLNTKFLKNQIM